MDDLKNRADDLTMITLLFSGALYIFIIINRSNIKPVQNAPLHPDKTTFNMTVYKDELDEVLVKASTENKTVIIAVVNKAYIEGDKSMLDLFLDGFWVGDGTWELKDHLLIVAVDQTSFERCEFLRLHCYKLKTEGVDFVGEKVYMSEDFIKMMWSRTLFLGDVLKRGYNFIFTEAKPCTQKELLCMDLLDRLLNFIPPEPLPKFIENYMDIDVIWLRNPFTRLNQSETVDLQISTDQFQGDQWSESNPINTGFYMIRSNNKTIALFDSWYSRKDNSTGMKEQDVLLMLMRKGLFRSLGLRVRFLDTLYFSGFCQDSKDVRVVSTVHANCCRTICAKMSDLMVVIHDWKRFKRSSANETMMFQWTKHTACVNSWKHN